MKTYVPNAAAIATANKKWYIIDAEGKTLGRLATEVARTLGRAMFKKLKVYAGSEHVNQAQKPEVYEF